MKKKLLDWVEILKETAHEFMENSGMKYSAALAYYTIFSLAPMLIVIIWVGGRFFGEKAIEGEIYDEIKDFVGNSAALQIQDMISVVSQQESGAVSAIIGLITLIIGATAVFIEIQDTLNKIWHVKPKPKKGLVKMLANRLLSFSMVIGIGFLMLVSLAINAILTSFANTIQTFIPKIYYNMTQAINFGLTFIIITTLFFLIFKFLPDAKIRWKDVITGALTTAVLFIISKFGIRLYLNYSDIGSAYGAAGSLILILAWVYYFSIILFFGAEFTQVYARFNGRAIIPAEYAVLVESREKDRIGIE